MNKPADYLIRRAELEAMHATCVKSRRGAIVFDRELEERRLKGRPNSDLRHCVPSEKPARTIAEIWRGDPWPRQLLLLDNDFFGNPEWRARLDEIIAGDFAVCFNQGINARMLNATTAAAIASVNYRDSKFDKQRIYTAWDGKKDERTLMRGLKALTGAGVKADNIMVYMLVGKEPGETHADRDYRRAKLREFGARPYPMAYVRTPELTAFAHWCVSASDKTIPWEQWWGKAKGEPRKLGDRRVSLPLFPEPDPEDEE